MIDRNGCERRFKERVLSNRPRREGYVAFRFWNGTGHVLHAYAHRLIALAFRPNAEGRPEVNHINGRRADNRPENLEWVTHAENMGHAGRTGALPRGERHHRAKLTADGVRSIRERPEARLADLARKHGVSNGTVRHVRAGITWRHLLETSKCAAAHDSPSETTA